MVKYSIEAIASLLKPIEAIPGRPTFGTLYRAQQDIVDVLRKLHHPQYPDDGFSGYMLPPRAFRLYNAALPWSNPSDVGEYFTTPALAVSDAEIRVAENEWQSKKDHHDNFLHLIAALRDLFERIIDPAYHSANMGRKGFGTAEPPTILFRLQREYGKPSLHEIDEALRRLNDPMDRDQPIEVMLRAVEEVQLFLLSHPEPDQELPDLALIKFALIKLMKTGLYSKLIERWNGKLIGSRRDWAQFRAHCVAEYVKLLDESGGPTLGNAGYSGAFNATTDDDTTSLTESIVQYAERATAAESKVSDLESRIAAIELGASQPTYGPPPPPQTAYYLPHAAYAAPQQPHVPPTVNIPPQWNQAVEQEFSFLRDRGGNAINTGRGKKRRTDNSPFVPPAGAPPNQWPNAASGPRRPPNRPRNAPFSNTMKTHQNLLYCFSCGYDVDHNGWQCPWPKEGHIPDVHRDVAHEVPGACMVAQHKTLPDGTGAGKGWILAQSITKAQYVMDGRRQWAQQQGRGGGGGRGNRRGNGNRGGRGGRGQGQSYQRGPNYQQWYGRGGGGYYNNYE